MVHLFNSILLLFIYNLLKHDATTTDESNSDDGDDEEDEPIYNDTESKLGIVGRFKTAQARKIEAHLTEEQLKTEQE